MAKHIRLSGNAIRQLLDHLEYTKGIKGRGRWEAVKKWAWGDASEYDIPGGVIDHLGGLHDMVQDYDEIRIDEYGVVIYRYEDI